MKHQPHVFIELIKRMVRRNKATNRIRKNTYPEIKGSARKAGKILPEIAEEFQFSSDVEVIVGTGDNPATAISTGCLGLGYPVISLGTSGIFMMPIEKPESQTRGKRYCFF